MNTQKQMQWKKYVLLQEEMFVSSAKILCQNIRQLEEKLKEEIRIEKEDFKKKTRESLYFENENPKNKMSRYLQEKLQECETELVEKQKSFIRSVITFYRNEVSEFCTIYPFEFDTEKIKKGYLYGAKHIIPYIEKHANGVSIKQYLRNNKEHLLLKKCDIISSEIVMDTHMPWKGSGSIMRTYDIRNLELLTNVFVAVYYSIYGTMPKSNGFELLHTYMETKVPYTVTTGSKTNYQHRYRTTREIEGAGFRVFANGKLAIRFQEQNSFCTFLKMLPTFKNIF